MIAAAPADTAARNAFLGSLIADAVAMPVHWYYNQQAIDRDYPALGTAAAYLAPQNPHADSILWRSSFTPPNEKTDILREQAQYWGQRGIHYHQFLAAGDNTLNYQLAIELYEFVRSRRDYDAAAWLDRYVAFMLTPGRHRDTYLEEYHRHFFASRSTVVFAMCTSAGSCRCRLWWRRSGRSTTTCGGSCGSTWASPTRMTV